MMLAIALNPPGATHCAATFQLLLRLHSHHKYTIVNR